MRLVTRPSPLTRGFFLCVLVYTLEPLDERTALACLVHGTRLWYVLTSSVLHEHLLTPLTRGLLTYVIYILFMNEFEYDMFIDGIENAHDDAEYERTYAPSEPSDDGDDDCHSDRW